MAVYPRTTSAGAEAALRPERVRAVNEVAQWICIAVMLVAIAWLFLCVYFERL
jgi:hypothetical protein